MHGVSCEPAEKGCVPDRLSSNDLHAIQAKDGVSLEMKISLAQQQRRQSGWDWYMDLLRNEFRFRVRPRVEFVANQPARILRERARITGPVSLQYIGFRPLDFRNAIHGRAGNQGEKGG